MQLNGKRVLITGGSMGIGFELADCLLAEGCNVAVCGRTEEKLRSAKAALPPLHIHQCDVSQSAERRDLATEVLDRFGGVDILINNAGIQREVNFLTDASAEFDLESEIDTNLKAAIHLSALLIPSMIRSDQPCAIVNVTSGLAFIPIALVPVYCATKAGLRSFSLSLRTQLTDTNIRVLEVIPPIVATNLHRSEAAKKTAASGVSPRKVAERTIQGLKKGAQETTIGRAADLRIASRLAPKFFHRLLSKAVNS